jgi:soluble lytic murein transglycosylase-like protein
MLHLAVLGWLIAASPTDPSSMAELVIEAQSPDEIALLEELAGWIDPAAAEASLTDAYREHRESFEVFRRFHGEAPRSAVLSTLPYGRAIHRSAARHGLDPLLLASIVEIESGFDPEAVSRRGAAGLMQVMPSTAGTGRAELCDPELNLDAGARYLRSLLSRYQGDLELALAAYNAGPTNVRRYGGVPPFRETRGYVDKVLEIYVDHHRRVWQDSDTADQLALL